MAHTIRKDSGSLPWHVELDGEFVQRFETRRTAALYIRLLGGDLTAAPDWYRDSFNSALRRMSRCDALRYAVGCAQLIGLGPAHVRADPATGEPLPTLSDLF